MKKIITVLLLMAFTAPVFATNYERVNKMNEFDIEYRDNSKNNSVVYVKGGTTVPVALINAVSTKDLNAGSAIKIKAERDIYADDYIIFKKGAVGEVYIGEMKKVKRRGRSAQIVLSDGYLTDIKGIQRTIILEEKIKAPNVKWAKVIGDAMVWNPIGWLMFFKKGKEIELQEGYRLTPVVAETFKVNRKGKKL